MPLQNRVDPWGDIHAVPARGTLMGNRGGRIHTPGRTLGKRRWASPHWIACELSFKDRRRELMGDSYTELFFLDEVTALAAGHRPCFECRRTEAKAFLRTETVSVFDARLHGERKGPKTDLPVVDLPDGSMFAIGPTAYARRNGQSLAWSFAGYIGRQEFKPDLRVKVLTAPSILAILHTGYQPRWHESALQWDDT